MALEEVDDPSATQINAIFDAAVGPTDRLHRVGWLRRMGLMAQADKLLINKSVSVRQRTRHALLRTERSTNESLAGEIETLRGHVRVLTNVCVVVKTYLRRLTDELVVPTSLSKELAEILDDLR